MGQILLCYWFAVSHVKASTCWYAENCIYIHTFTQTSHLLSPTTLVKFHWYHPRQGRLNQIG